MRGCWRLYHGVMVETGSWSLSGLVAPRSVNVNRRLTHFPPLLLADMSCDTVVMTTTLWSLAVDSITVTAYCRHVAGNHWWTTACAKYSRTSCCRGTVDHYTFVAIYISCPVVITLLTNCASLPGKRFIACNPLFLWINCPLTSIPIFTFF